MPVSRATSRTILANSSQHRHVNVSAPSFSRMRLSIISLFLILTINIQSTSSLNNPLLSSQGLPRHILLLTSLPRHYRAPDLMTQMVLRWDKTICPIDWCFTYPHMFLGHSRILAHAP